MPDSALIQAYNFSVAIVCDKFQNVAWTASKTAYADNRCSVGARRNLLGSDGHLNLRDLSRYNGA